MGNDAEPAKILLPYLQRADELQKHEHLVAYYCRLYAMERGLRIPQKERTKTTSALLVSLMNQLEKDRKALTLGPDDSLYVEGFASNVFAKADKQDRAGRADLNTAKTFYAASIFFEILHQFGELQPEIEQKQKYAVWKAAEIRKAIKEGRRPEPGPPGGDQDLSVPVDVSLEGDKSSEQLWPDKSQAGKPNDSEKPVRDAGTVQESPSQFPRSVQHYSADEMGTRPAFSAPEYQTTAAQAPVFSPPDYQTAAVHGSHLQTPQDFSEYSQGSPIAYAPSHYTMPAAPQDNHTGQLGAAYPYSSTASLHENVISPRLNHSFSTMHDGSLDSQPGSHGSYPSNASYYQNTNVSHPGTVPYHLNSQSNPEYQPNTHYTSVAGTNGTYGERRQPDHISTVPEAAPAVTYSYDRNYQPPPGKIAEAHKAAKLAIGSLAFDDVPAAVDYLKRSLELLTLPSTG